jgi:hypothetical protein
MPPFEERRAYCLICCCRSVGLTVHQQFPFILIFFALVAHIEMKFGIQIYRTIYRKNIQNKFCFWYDRAIFAVLFTFFALVAHIEMNFGIKIF